MKIERTKLNGATIFTPDVYKDERGLFTETFNSYYPDFKPVQANYSVSKKGTIRGLHYGILGAWKLVWVVKGSIFDVAFNRYTGEWIGEILSAENHKQLLVPSNCAHGFQALEDDTIVCYLQDVLFKDTLDKGYCPLDIIDWPLKDYVVSDKDKNADKFSL